MITFKRVRKYYRVLAIIEDMLLRTPSNKLEKQRKVIIHKIRSMPC